MIYHLTHLSADLARAEYHTPSGRWHRAVPPPDAPRLEGGWPDMPADDQRACPHGGLYLRPRTLYRATNVRLSPLPPFAPLLAPIAYLPSPLALERGLSAPACAGDGYIYLSSAITAHCHIPPRSHLLTSVHALTDADAARAAAGALRRAHLVAPAEQVAACALRPADLARVLGDIAAAAPAWVASMRPVPEGQLHPGAGLVEILRAALAVVRGEPLPAPEPRTAEPKETP
jgi:hypothetical protein